MHRASLAPSLLVLAGCSLDLDRLRTRDVGTEALDVGAALDTPTSPLDAAADDAPSPRDTLGVLRTHPTGSMQAFTVARDDDGAWLVYGGAATVVTDVSRSECEAHSERDHVTAFDTKLLAVADLDDDGDLDVVAANGDGFVPILSQPDRALSLGVLTPHGVGQVTAIDVGHFGGDASIDLVLFGALRETALYAQEAGRFVVGSPVAPAPMDATILDGAVLDQNGDGIDDLVRLLSRATPSGSSLEYFQATTAGTFGAPAYQGVGRTQRLRAFDRASSAASGTNDEVFITTADGTDRWDIPPTTRTVRDVAFAEVHAGAPDELVVAYADGLVSVYDVGTRGELTHWQSVWLDGPDTSLDALVALDLDLDGSDEIFVSAGDAIVILGLRRADCP